jgi:hypothetical protein
VTRIIVPLYQDEPFIPDMQMVYWVDTTILPPGDPEPDRPAVVVLVPTSTVGTVHVVTRSSTDPFGVPHARAPDLGLNKPGRFSRLQSVQCQLWTPGNVRSTGKLDAATFAAVRKRFRL